MHHALVLADAGWLCQCLSHRPWHVPSCRRNHDCTAARPGKEIVYNSRHDSCTANGQKDQLHGLSRIECVLWLAADSYWQKYSTQLGHMSILQDTQTARRRIFISMCSAAVRRHNHCVKCWTQHGADCGQRLGSQALLTALVGNKAEEIFKIRTTCAWCGADKRFRLAHREEGSEELHPEARIRVTVACIHEQLRGIAPAWCECC